MKGDILEDSIVIALQVEQERSKARKVFEEEGYHKIVCIENNLELLLHCTNNLVDILLVDMAFPFMDCVSTLRYIRDNRLVKIIIAVDDDWEKSRLTLNLDCIDIFVTKPIEARKIIPGLLVGMSRKEKMEQLEREYEQAESELRDQKTSSYALQLVMDKMRLDEDRAKTYLQQVADASGKEIQEVCEIVYSVLCNRKNVVK